MMSPAAAKDSSPLVADHSLGGSAWNSRSQFRRSLQARERRDRGGLQRDRDPFPVPVPVVRNRSMQHPPARRSRAAIGRELRIAEAPRSLNFLSSATAARARHGSWHEPEHRFSKTRSGGQTTEAQRSILDGVRERIDAYGDCPSDLSGPQALSALLKSDDPYSLGGKNLAAYQPELLKVAKSEVRPKVATHLLPEDSARFLLEYEKYILRPESEVREWHAANPHFQAALGPFPGGFSPCSSWPLPHSCSERPVGFEKNIKSSVVAGFSSSGNRVVKASD
mgnify:CR=1 FL=1